ncbi:VrtR2 [Penicillium taxi]|uniref:VrtR2 n=1 Tax=Penicillium taxi TaxID=168475 RepID=UPI002544E26A|nr:VrtR2 [Penicillium taxi]KAJ5908598.1 VrtR2 [Penicillium taxi]
MHAKGQPKLLYFGNELPNDDLNDLFRRLLQHSKDRRFRLLNAAPYFDNILTLSEQGYLRELGLGAAMESAFLLILQLGLFIGHHEASDSELNILKHQSVASGLSVGLFSGAAIALSTTLAEVVKNGAECLRVSFRLGVYVNQFSSKLEAPQTDGMLQSWAHVVTGLTEDAADKSSVSFSGPPSRIKSAFLQSSELRYSKSLTLPVYDGLYHTTHAYSQDDVRAVLDISSSMIPASRPVHISIISSRAGTPFTATTAGELLSEIVTELISDTIYLDQVLAGILRHIGAVPGMQICRIDSFRTSVIFKGILEAIAAEFPEPSLVWHVACRVYLRNIDPIIKILHRPSLSKWMIDNGPYLTGLSEGNIPVRALEFAVCYVTTNSMTEKQCQAEFRKNKSSIVAVYRKMCEDTIEMTGLLTTRHMVVLQAFTLYLVGRRSEEKGTAVWMLVTLASRLASAMGLNQEPGTILRVGESFFQQQMRMRLWLTICLMDLQSSFAQNSEPLISYRDAASAIGYVAQINDSEFDMDTTQAVSSHEDLTDITFALITYHVQVAGRLLNFDSTESSASGATSTTSNDYLSSASVLSLAFTLLHYCDPESSPYAWFTWHSTPLIVSELRVSELLPFRCGFIGSQIILLRTKDDKILLQRALKNLEKSQLILSDSRSDGFRWYITVPWLALTTAIVECNNCTDVGLLLRAWPVIEASYQHYKPGILQNSQISQTPLEQLMTEIRDKLAPIIQGATLFESSQGFNRVGDSVRLLQTAIKSRVQNTGISIDPSLDSGSLSEVPLGGLGQPFVQQSWDSPESSNSR